MENVIIICGCVGEHFGVGLESDFCAGNIGVARYCHRLNDSASCKFHMMNFAVFVNFNFKPLRKRVYNRRADAVKTARNLVSAAAELTACVKNGEYYLESAFACLFLDVNGNTASVIRNADDIALFDINLDVSTVSRKRFVD